MDVVSIHTFVSGRRARPILLKIQTFSRALRGWSLLSGAPIYMA